MSAEVWEQVYDRAGRADRGASHDARLRQHAPAGRAGDAPAVGAPRRGRGRRASRQPRQGAAARRRAAAQARRAEGAGRDRLARARHRHRRGRPRLPARLAALDRELPAARRPLRPLRSTARPRAGCSRSRATSWSSARRCSTASAAASSTGCRSPSSRSTCWRSRSSPRSPRGMAGGRALRAVPARLAVPRAGARRTSRPSSPCWPKASAPGAAGAAR